MALPGDFGSTFEETPQAPAPLLPRQAPLTEKPGALPGDFGEMFRKPSVSIDEVDQNLHLTRQLQPDAVAKDKQLGLETGFDPELVGRNRDFARSVAERNSAMSILADAPGTTRFLASDRLNTAMAKDDLPALTGIEGTLKSGWDRLSTGYDVGTLSTELSRLRYAQNMGDESPATSARVAELKQKMQMLEGATPANLFERGAKATGEQTPIQMEIARVAGTRALQGAAGGAMIGTWMFPGLGTLAGAGAGAGAGVTAGTVEASFMLETGSSFDEFLDAGMGKETAKWASRLYGAAAAAVETISLGPLKKMIPGLSGSTEAAKAPIRQTIKRVVLEYTKNASQAQLAESFEEGLQTVLQDVAQWAGEQYEGKDPTFDWAATLGKAKEAMIDTMLVPFAPAMGAPKLGVDIAQVRAENRQAEAAAKLGRVFAEQAAAVRVDGDIARLDELRVMAQESKLRQRDPAAFEAVIQHQIDEHPDNAPAEVLISGPVLAQAVEAAGQEAKPLVDALGLEQSALAEAAVTGADVSIPFSKYLAHMVGTDLDATVAKDMRLRRDAMTINERDAWMKESEKDLQSIVNEATEARARNTQLDEDAMRIEQVIGDELAAAANRGTAAVAPQNAKVYSAFFTTMAARGWLDHTHQGSSWNAFRSTWPTVQSVDRRTAQPGQGLMQQDSPALAGADFNDPAQVADAQKQWAEKGVESPYFKKWFGESKVVDEQGKPLVVYRGSSTDQAFEGDKFFFSANPDHAAFFAGGVVESGPEGRAPRMYPTYLTLKSPLVVEGGTRRVTPANIDSWISKARAAGHDGLVVKNYKDANAGVGDTYIAFDPTQIKSATGNRGTFDASDPRILMQLSPEAKQMADRVAAALQQGEEGPKADSEVALPPTTLYQVQNLPEWRGNVEAWMKANGYKAKEIKAQLAAMEGQMKIFSALGDVQLELLPQGVKENKGERSKGTGGPFRTNADPIYKITFDASAMCVKRLEAAATTAYVQSQIGRALTTSERMALVALFKAAGKTAPCLYCYVEAPRAKMATFAQKGIDIAFGKAIPKNWSKSMQALAADAQAEATKLGLAPEEVQANMFIDPDYIAAHLDEIEALTEKAPVVSDFIRKAALAAKANLPKRYEEYVSQVLDIPQNIIDELNNYAGLRFFSSSDFQAEHVADLMQAFFDMELRQIRAHGYTKVPMFIKIFGDTGMKIQTSIFAKEVDGKIVADEWQGMKWAEAQAFREKHENVGTVLVATSDATARWGLKQDWIDYIIPFHYSGMEGKHYKELGWQDFTSTQSEKSIKKLPKGEKPNKIRMHDVGVAEGIADADATRKYLELAMERGLYPVFPALLFKDMQTVTDPKERTKQTKAARARWARMAESGQIDWAQINPGYFKLKKDYARTDTAFQPVQAKFNLDEAQAALDSFLEGKEPKAKVDNEIADRLVQMINEAEGTGRDIGVEMLRKVREEKTLLQSVFHGSPTRGITKMSLDYIGSGEGNQAYGYGLYFAGNRMVADKQYRERLSEHKFWESDAPDALLEKAPKKIAKDAEYLLEYAREYGFEGAMNHAEKYDYSPQVIKWLKAARKEAGGQLYEVTIPDDDTMLDWDKPLSEQPEQVKKALGDASAVFRPGMGYSSEAELRTAIVGDDGVTKADGSLKKGLTIRQGADGQWNIFEDGLTGEKLYRELVQDKGSDRAASEYLKSIGIPGLRYLDGTSRSKGEGSHNYVVFDDAQIAIDKTHYQDRQNSAHGMVTFGAGPSGTPIITLFETANESTFLHESGHIFLEFLKATAEADGAPQELSDLWSGVSKEIGHEGGEIGVDAHEKWARALEMYFREGKTPSRRLVHVFQTFASWLRKIYSAFTADGYKPSPELSSMFDRLFATDAEIQEVEALHEARKPFFTTLDSMAEAERQKYEKLREKAAVSARDKALARYTEAYIQALGGKEAFLAEARKEADGIPVYKALKYIAENGGLELAAVEDLMGEEARAKLVKKTQVGAITKNGALDPDRVAEMHGFKSGEEMLSQILAAEGKTPYVKRRADEMMKEKKDSVVRGLGEDGVLAAEVDYHNEDRLAVLVAEAEMLRASSARAKGNEAAQAKMLEAAAVREVAKQALAGKPVSKAVSYAAFSRAELTAGRNARRAMDAGKTEEALSWKRQEMLNHALVLEAIEARDRVRKGVAYVKGKVKSKTIEQEARDLITDIAVRFGFQPRPPRTTLAEQVAGYNEYLNETDAEGNKRKEIDFQAWATTNAQKGHGVVLTPMVTDRSNFKEYEDLTLAEFDEILGAAKQIAHVDLEDRTYKTEAGRIALEQVVGELVGQLEQTFGPKARSQFEATKALNKIKGAFREADASLVKMELLFKVIDGGKMGPWFKYIMDRANVAAETEDDRMHKAANDLSALMHKHYNARERANMFGKRVHIPELGHSMTKAQLLRVLMDFGNEGNYIRRRDGNGWTDEQMDALKKYADKRDWDFIQETWDYIDTYRPEAFALHKSTTGVEPERIMPRPVETPHGTYAGGYFPSVMDKKENNTAKARQQIEDSILYGTPNFAFVQTKQGHLKQRAKNAGGQVLSIEMSDLTDHVFGVIHDITHREAAMNVAKVFRNKTFVAAVEERLGKEYADLLIPWIKDIANTPIEPVTRFEKMFRAVRLGTTVARLGKIAVGLQQAAGLTQTVAQMKGDSWRLAATLGKYMVNPVAFYKDLKFANDSSSFMRHRITTATRETTDAFRGLSVKDRYLSQPGKFMLKFLGGVQKMATDVPSWNAAYAAELKRSGDHAQAVKHADQIVRISQGSGQVKDLTAIQRSKSEMVKSITMFYSFLSSAYAQITNPLRGKKPHFGEFLLTTTMLALIGPSLAEILSGRGPDDEDDDGNWAIWAARNSLRFGLSLVPGVKDVAGSVMSGFGYKMSPVESPIQSAVYLLRHLPQAIEDDEYEKIAKPALDVLGVWAKLPSDQLYITSVAALKLLEDDPSYTYLDLVYKHKKD